MGKKKRCVKESSEHETKSCKDEMRDTSTYFTKRSTMPLSFAERVSENMKSFPSKRSFRSSLVGGSKPKVATPAVVEKIEELKKESPNIFAWEIREKLIQSHTCKSELCPSVSSINRIIRNGAAKRVLIAENNKVNDLDKTSRSNNFSQIPELLPYQSNEGKAYTNNQSLCCEYITPSTALCRCHVYEKCNARFMYSILFSSKRCYEKMLPKNDLDCKNYTFNARRDYCYPGTSHFFQYPKPGMCHENKITPRMPPPLEYIPNSSHHRNISSTESKDLYLK